MNIFQKIAWPFKKIAELFGTDRWKKIVETVDDILPDALNIIEKTGIDIENATVKQILDLYEKYKIGFNPDELKITDCKYSKSNALLNLSTQMLKEKKPNIGTSIARAAIHLALVLLKK
jgi:hypothetical protein